MTDKKMLDSELTFSHAMLEEIVHWVKTLSNVGVSPDKAAEVSTKVLLTAASFDDDDDYLDEDYEEDSEAD